MMGDRLTLKLRFSSWQWLFWLLLIAIFSINIVACSGGSSSNHRETKESEPQALESCSETAITAQDLANVIDFFQLED